MASPTPLDERTRPPTVLALVAHPIRWSLLVELGRSDRTVNELVERIGQPQNLVSYHLGKMRSAAVVSSRRSSADGRDAYYSLDIAHLGRLLTSTAATLHPALGPPAHGSPGGGGRRTKPRVLFLCTGNSGRSPMAEALLRARSGGAVESFSAGSHPKPLHPDAVRVLRDGYDIDIEGRDPVHLRTFSRRRVDWVVTLCDRVREVCPDRPGGPEPVHWSIPDPSAEAAADPDDPDASYAAYQRAATEIARRIEPFLAVVHPAP